ACYRDYLELLARGPAGKDAEAHAAWATAILHAFDRFRVLCAVREGDWGMAGLNRAIEHALARARLLSPRGTWYRGRPVMVTRNDAALGVFNGDIGITLPTAEHASLRVYFLDGERLRSVAVSRLAQVDTAFAMTVHKSQGSEFEHTALVLSAHSGSVLTRELIYTGITRARKAFSLFAERPGLLEQGVMQATRRESGLARIAQDQISGIR
ncbi:MAG: ATP-binding domain-containing protein, partial [Thauera sp.]